MSAKRMQIRVYDGYPTVSVVRGDDRMLVTPYLRFFIGSNSPTFEFRSDQAPKMFTATPGISRTPGTLRRTGPHDGRSSGRHDERRPAHRDRDPAAQAEAVRPGDAGDAGRL